MRYLPLLAGLLACGPALAQSVPPRITAPTDPTQAVNLAYLNSALATAAANAANAANLSSGVLSAARLPTGPGGVPILDGTGKLSATVIPAGTTPTLATVATSGSYADLTGKPTIPAAPGLATASTPGLMIPGAGLLVTNGTVSVDSVVPAVLSGSPQATDGILMVRGGVSYLVPFSAFGSGTSGGGATPAPTPTPTASSYTFEFLGETNSSSMASLDFNVRSADGQTRYTPSTLPAAGWGLSVGWSKSSTVAPTPGSPAYSMASWNTYQAGFWHSEVTGYPLGGAPGTYYPWVITSDGATYCFATHPFTFQ